MENKVELFLDSGAYSAWTQGQPINIQDYIKFIKKYQDVIHLYANLDVIGDATGTWENQQIMEKAGLHPMPCYHYGEAEKWLERYLSKGYKYIALGGMVPISTQMLIHWLDHLFQAPLANPDGTPKVKVHGFGLTSLRLMLRYPWYSVDSTSWVITGRLGSVYVPRWKGDKWVYDEESWKVAVSNRSPSQKEAGKHLSTFSPLVQKMILTYLKDKGMVVGKSEFRKEPEKYKLKEGERWSGKAGDPKREVELVIERGLCNDYKLRDELNIIYFQDLEKSMSKWPWSFKKQNNIKGFGF